MNQKRRGASILTPLADREFPIRGHYIVCIVRYASFFFQSRFLHEADAKCRARMEMVTVPEHRCRAITQDRGSRFGRRGTCKRSRNSFLFELAQVQNCARHPCGCSRDLKRCNPQGERLTGAKLAPRAVLP